MVICWNCRNTMIWGNDFSFEDWGLDREGIVSSFSCNTCETTAEFFVPEIGGADDSSGEND